MVSLSLAQKNVTRKQERSLLTVVGVILAVGSFVALLSIAEGLYQRLQREVYSRDIDIYIFSSSTIPLPTGPIGAIGYTSEDIHVMRPIHNVRKKQTPEKAAPVTKADQKPIIGNIIDYLRLPDPPAEGDDSADSEFKRAAYAKFPESTAKIDNIKSVIGVTRFQDNTMGSTVIIWGIPYEPTYWESEKNFLTTYFSHFNVVGGGMLPTPTASREDPYCTEKGMKISDLTPADANKESQKENLKLIMGEKIARDLNLKVGDKYPIRRGLSTINLEVCCIGRFNTGFQDYFCFVPVQTALALQDTPGKVKEIWIQVSDKNEIENTRDELKRAFPDLNVITSKKYLGDTSEIVKYAWFLQFAIAMIGILIATTASMNTMLMSTFERIREFGALRAIGAPRLTVIMMILIESLILSITGGIFGIIVGLLGSKFLDTAVMALFQTSFPLAHITAPLILYAFLLSVSIGLIGALIPAIIIYRMDVIQALRWE